jgi:vacuolar protein sorting-associated protein 51
MDELQEFEEDSNAGSGSEDSLSDDGDKPDKIMSMFSSYYGMEAEEEAAPEEDEDAGAMEIDSPNFNANIYVKELLLHKHGTDLIAEDTKMIHEIRSLDSDMQMLVYENYNKFISATETIKRMKHNVEAMEEDMASVR